LDAAPATAARTPQFFAQDNECYVTCADGARLRITAMDLDGKPFNATDFRARFGNQPINLEITTQ
jgi:hypothetical protein